MAVVSIENGTLAIEVGLVWFLILPSSFCRCISFSAKYRQYF
jgi:hypothetical protein